MTRGPNDWPTPGNNNPEVPQVIMLIRSMKAQGLTKEEAAKKLVQMKGFSENEAMVMVQMNWN